MTAIQGDDIHLVAPIHPSMIPFIHLFDGLSKIGRQNFPCQPIVIDRVALAKQGDNAIGSIHPFLCLSVCQSVGLSVRALL